MNTLRAHRWPLLSLLGLLALILLALTLRWQYAATISLYVDEFTTLWAAKRVLASGVPIMPSGVLYTRGLLATYVTAGAGWLAGGLTYTVGRLPSILFGLASMIAVFGLGRREWNSRVGWLAAVGLALLPEAVVWSGRARFYAQLQFFTVLTLWAAYAAIQYRGEPQTPAGMRSAMGEPRRNRGVVEESQTGAGMRSAAGEPHRNRGVVEESQTGAGMRSAAGEPHRNRGVVEESQTGAGMRSAAGEPHRNRGVVPADLMPLLFAALFTVAVFTQEQTVLLYPPILLAALLWRGWRYLLQPRVWPAHLLCLGAMAARFAVEIVGQPGYFETIQAERPYVGLILDLPAAWAAYAPLLLAPERLPWTLFALLAVAAALFRLWRVRGRMAQLAPYHQATLFFALQFGFVLAFILLFVGGQWRETRYLFLVQPLWLLVGAAGAVWAVDWVGMRIWARGAAAEPSSHLQGYPRRPSRPYAVYSWGLTAVLALLVALSLWQPVQGVLSRQVEGYDRVLAYVADHRQPGDVTMTPQPPACAFVLGPCDYYAVQKVYEEFVVPRGLQPGAPLVDRWSGAALLNDAGTLEEVIRAAPAVWFITDRFRLATRYDEAFLRTVIDQFDIAFEERGVLALVARGWREGPPLVTEPLPAPLTTGPLTLTGWAHSAPVAGQDMAVTLTWQANAPIDRQINTSFRLLDAAGTVVAQQDGPPAAGILPTNLFFSTPLPDSKPLFLPADLPPGEYQLQVVAYAVETVTPVGEPLLVGNLTIGQ